MKRIVEFVTGFVILLALGALFQSGVSGQAQTRRRPRLGMRSAARTVPAVKPHTQEGCKSFAGVAQATLPTSTPIAATDVWGGPLHAVLGGEFLGDKAVLSGNDGEEAWYEEETLGTGKGGLYTVCLNHPDCSDSFTLAVPVSVFPNPRNDLGTYIGYDVNVVQGTGKFSGASGDLKFRGSFIAWLDESSPLGVSGRWYPEISGTICGIQ